MSQQDLPTLPIELVVRNGRCVRLRHVRSSDKAFIREGLKHFSRRSTYQRFFTPVVRLSEAQLQYLTEVDGERHVALGALDITTAPARGVGIARYIRLEATPQVAEAAVSVLDAYQSCGIGSVLLVLLSRCAAASEIETFRAYVLADNRRFVRYLMALGADISDTGGGILQVDLPVYARREEMPDGPNAATAHWAWQQVDEALGG